MASCMASMYSCATDALQRISCFILCHALQEDDANVRSIFSRFVKRMEVVESIIQARNQDPQYITRDPKKDGLPYTLLIPGSDAGVTMRGVPYSISIQMVSLIDMAWGFAGFMRSVQGSVYTERFGSPAAQGPAHDSCSVQP